MNRLLLAGAVLAVWLMTAGTALANGMPMGALLRPGGGAARPDRTTTVAVVQEDLTLDLREAGMQVRAGYDLYNEGAEALSFTVAFAVPVLQSVPVAAVVPPTVTVDGEAVAAVPWELPVQVDAETAVDQAWRDPYTGQSYQPDVHGWQRGTHWFAFPLAFGPGQNRRLEVSYGQALSTDFSRFVERTDRADYLLLPARHWSRFGGLALEVLAPPGRTVWSSVPLEPAGGGRYTAHLQGLPAQNLSLFLAPTAGKGLLSSLWLRRESRPWLLLLLTVFGSVAGALLLRSKRNGLRGAGALLRWLWPVVVLILTPAHLFEPNPIGLIMTMFLFMPGLVLAHVGAGWAAQRVINRRSQVTASRP